MRTSILSIMDSTKLTTSGIEVILEIFDNRRQKVLGQTVMNWLFVLDKWSGVAPALIPPNDCTVNFQFRKNGSLLAEYSRDIVCTQRDNDDQTYLYERYEQTYDTNLQINEHTVYWVPDSDERAWIESTLNHAYHSVSDDPDDSGDEWLAPVPHTGGYPLLFICLSAIVAALLIVYFIS